MKIPTLFILSFGSCYAQNITFKEIKLKPKAKFYNKNKTTIIYPVVITNSVQINRFINNKIKKEIIDVDNEKTSARTALNEHINEGLINMSYEVTFKKYNILSLNIYAEGCGAHCSLWYTYFNFDLRTGKDISITDLVSGNKLDSFQKIVLTDKQKFLNQVQRRRV